MYLIQACSTDNTDAVALLEKLSETLAKITGDNGRSSFQTSDVLVAGSLFVIARTESGIPVGCGAYRPLRSGVAEVKRMFALPRTKGAGSAILRFLEEKAIDDGYTEICLETRLVNQRAVLFYRRNGYNIIPNFGKYIGNSEAVCLSKFVSE